MTFFVCSCSQKKTRKTTVWSKIVLSEILSSDTMSYTRGPNSTSVSKWTTRRLIRSSPPYTASRNTVTTGHSMTRLHRRRDQRCHTVRKATDRFDIELGKSNHVGTPERSSEKPASYPERPPSGRQQCQHHQRRLAQEPAQPETME